MLLLNFSGRTALLTGTKSKNEGVTFETHKEKVAVADYSKEESVSSKRFAEF